MLGTTTQLWASGRAPIAIRDSATVARGGVVETLADGSQSVLDNDYDREDDELTAVLSSGVKHGSLEFRNDGTFRYVHDGGNDDSDSFEYRAYDGRRYSRRARVTIEIEAIPNSPPVVVGDVADQEATMGICCDSASKDCQRVIP